MSILTDSNAAAFQLRDDLSDWLLEGFEVDERVTFREGVDPQDFALELAEALVRNGWVERAPVNSPTEGSAK